MKKPKDTGNRLDTLARWYYLSGAFGLILSCIIPTTTAEIVSDLNNPTAMESRGMLIDYTPDSPYKKQVTQFAQKVVITGSVATLVAATLALLTAYAGRCLQKREHPALIKTLAAWNLIWLPHGTILAVTTFCTMKSPEAKRQFAARANTRGAGTTLS